VLTEGSVDTSVVEVEDMEVVVVELVILAMEELETETASVVRVIVSALVSSVAACIESTELGTTQVVVVVVVEEEVKMPPGGYGHQ
jgi:hypothetical protein